MRKPVSSPQNQFFDAENVDDTDLTLEQDHNTQSFVSIIDNHLGSGILSEALSQHILFDSSLATGLLDAKALNPQAQPSDSNNGNQLEVNLLNSLAAGKRTVKVIIIGLDFQNNLQYDTFTFAKNEKQLTSKHYRTILTILLNDLIGTPLQSLNLGGQIIIREVSPMSLSRDPIMIAQDIEPNLIFRDFFTPVGTTLNNLLVAALPNYNINNLNINTGFRQLRSLVENDISSQIGEKFLASTNNIQKITLLLSVINNATPSNLVWTGDILISLYELQSTVSCPSDIVPNLAIDFDPSNIPLSQISLTYNDLLANGYALNTVPQPIDFVFSNTAVGSGLLIKPGNYYAVTVKRAGNPDTCQIQLAVGGNTSSSYREVLFNGSIWVDVPEESLWFQVWTDAAKVADGQAYDNGNGIQIPKTTIDSDTGLTIDNVFNQQPFLRNDLYYALMEADLQSSVPVQDERTGNPINSQKEFVPSLQLLNINGLNNIQDVSNPVILGTITDQNVKSSNPGTATLSAKFHEYGFVKNQIVFKVITDTTDGYRYDANLVELVSELVNGNLNNAKIISDISNPSNFYRIAKAELFTMLYGDTNGDGVIDTNDLLLAQKLVGSNLNIFPTDAQYITQTTFFVNDTALTWQILDVNSVVLASGTDGILTVNPLDGTLANFNSASANFNSLLSLNTDSLVISGDITNPGNNGSFFIDDLIDNHNLTIRKSYYTSDTLLQILRTDINTDMQITVADINYITNYIELVPPFPSPTAPANRLGTPFTAVRLTLEAYVDRGDDYPGSDVNRAVDIHILPDIFADGYGDFAGRNVETNPISFNIIKQLTWEDYNIVSNSNPRLVPVAYTLQSGFTLNNCGIEGITTSQSFPTTPNFDPGRNDIFIPNNLIINSGGQLTTPAGAFFKVDFEVNTIAFIVPPNNFLGEKTINLLTDFIADFSTTGYTRLGFPAMKFADCSLVTMDAFANNQIRVEAGLLSLSPQLNGIDIDGYTGITIDSRDGINIDYSTGLMTLQFNNLYEDPVQQTLNTKIQITVFLKKAGWNNTPITITSDRTKNLLGL
jgi:hypothetical protein